MPSRRPLHVRLRVGLHTYLLFAIPVSDLNIQRAADFLIAQFGDNALAKVREMVETMRRRGDTEGADTRLRIIVAIGTPGAPPTDNQH
jgi:hypothetical protein